MLLSRGVLTPVRRVVLVVVLSALTRPPILAADPLPATIVGKDGAPMVLVPAGEFVMGNDAGRPDERPAHRVTLDAFYLDVYEVTVMRYGKFLRALDVDPPFLWKDARDRAQAEKPVIGVNWYDANEYCRWAGKRLPTEAEWEKAARGTDDRLYPWGNEPPGPSRATYGRETEKGYAALANVGSHAAGRSPYGAEDLAGNVWEWVADRYDEHYYRSSPPHNPPGPERGVLRVVRGGAWNSPAGVLKATNRSGYPANARRSDFGFRCARDGSK